MQTIEDNVCQTLSKHLPLLKANAYGLDEVRLHANSLVRASLEPERTFGLATDRPDLEALQRSLLQAKSSFKVLSKSTKTQLLLGMHGAEQKMSLAGITAAMDALLLSTRNVLRWTKGRGEFTGKRNWAAASVAFECQYLWGLHQRLVAGDFPPKPLRHDADGAEFEALHSEWLQRLWANVPVSQRHHDPGPMGRLIEDVFEDIGLLMDDGSPVRAATALQSIRDFERKEQEEN
ncbi:MAG: hypothetical protein AAFO57_00770 [Pseudomonadota bacterium]